MHPITILAAANNTACSWTCQWKQGWDSTPTPASSAAPTHGGDVKLIAIVIVVALIIWGLGKMRRIAS